jgi:excisionase family DNA binding protein
MEILTLEQACELTTLAPSTMRLYARTRRIPSFKLGTRVRFSREDLEAWLQARRRGGSEGN